MATGRTVSRWVRFIIKDSGATLREIPIDTLSVVGLTYKEQDLTAFQDAVIAALPGQPNALIDISGPFDNTAVTAIAGSGAAPTLSGSHTVLSALALPAAQAVPISLGVDFGIRNYWSTGDPVFGISSSASAGYICVAYTVDASKMSYKAKFVLFPGSTAPTWGTAQVT